MGQRRSCVFGRASMAMPKSVELSIVVYGSNHEDNANKPGVSYNGSMSMS